MFKAALIYRISIHWQSDAVLIDQALKTMPFTECGPTQERSIGWVPPRGEQHGALLEVIGGQWIAKLMIESKAFPSAILKRKVDEKALHIEQTEGRKPGKKERKELRDDAVLELLPLAFAKQSAMLVWIDPTARLLMIDTASEARADEVATLLVQALPGFATSPILAARSPAAAMAEWLVSGESPAEFSVDRECELKSCDENKSTVRYAKHSLDIDEVRHHITTGKMPTKLALTYADRISFVLTDKLTIKKIQFLDVVTKDCDTKDDHFDADAAITTGELSRMIPALFEALGGLQQQETLT